MQFGDHGVVDVFKQYPSKDVVLAVLALSRLQKAALCYAEEHHSLAKEVDDPELLENLAHYAKFAHAAYGWKMDLALRGKLHLGDYQAMLKQTGVREEDVVAAHWQSKTHRPVSSADLCLMFRSNLYDYLACFSSPCDKGVFPRARCETS
jgi:hypothetical protein